MHIGYPTHYSCQRENFFKKLLCKKHILFWFDLRLYFCLSRKSLEKSGIAGNISPEARPTAAIFILQIDVSPKNRVFGPQSCIEILINAEADLLMEHAVNQPADLNHSNVGSQVCCPAIGTLIGTVRASGPDDVRLMLVRARESLGVNGSPV